MKSITENNEIKELSFEIKKTKHKHEFQELGESLEPIYGKAIWTLFYKPNFTEYKIRKAHQIAQDRNILEFKYLVGIIKRLP